MSSRSKRSTSRKHVTYPRLNLSVATSPTSTSTSTTTYPRLQLSVATTTTTPTPTQTQNGYVPSSTRSSSPLTIHTYGIKPKLELTYTTTSTTIDTTTPSVVPTTTSDIDIHTRLEHDPIILHEDEWPDVDAIVEAHRITLQTHQSDTSNIHDITPSGIPHDIPSDPDIPYDDEMDEYPPLSYLYADDDDDDADAEYQRHLANFDELTQRTETCDTQVSIVTVPYIEEEKINNWIDDPTQVQDGGTSSIPPVYVSKLDRFHQMHQYDDEKENVDENVNDISDDQYEDGTMTMTMNGDEDISPIALDDMEAELAPTPPLEEYDG